MKRDEPGPNHQPRIDEAGRIRGVVIQFSPFVTYSGDHVLAELHRPDWAGVFAKGEPIEHLYTVNDPSGGMRGEWYVHEHTLDRYVILSGRLDLGLYDSRSDSPTHGVFDVVSLGEPGSGLPDAVRIPPLVWHSLKWQTPAGKILNSKLPPYNPARPDKFRIPLEDLPDAITWDVDSCCSTWSGDLCHADSAALHHRQGDLSVKILAVIPTLARDVDRLNDTIRSLRVHAVARRFEILVVNNSGGTEISGLAPVDYVFSPGINLGYVGALELARRSYSCDFLWSIQDDMTLDNDVLDVLVTAMSKSSCLAVASPILVRNGIVPARTRAGIFTNPQRTRWENYPPVDTPPAELAVDVDFSFVSGSGALFRSTALADIKGFNLDLYPLMHVDVDVCAKLLGKGWQIALEPQARIQHQIQGSTSRLLGQTLYNLNTPIVEQHLEGRTAESCVGFDPVDASLLFDVARRASFLFLEVSREAESHLREAQSQREETESHLHEVQLRLDRAESYLVELHQSRSWKITAPLRALVSLIRRWR